MRGDSGLGAEAVNYSKGDWVNEIKKLTGGRGADVIKGALMGKSRTNRRIHGAEVHIL